jgi:hypothetical protein
VEDLKIIPIENVATQAGGCFLTIHYSNFKEAAREAAMLSNLGLFLTGSQPDAPFQSPS